MQAVTPITQANGVQVIFASLTGDILLDALIGAMFAIISYSSLAAVLLTATLTAAGIIDVYKRQVPDGCPGSFRGSALRC